MARIRSVHPGFFKDAAYGKCSAFARLLAIGLWQEADDQGVFKWDTWTLKVSIFPGDNIDLDALTAELEAQDIIRRFEVSGRHYGAVRNFQQYQRPKKPKYWHPLPATLKPYVEGKGEPESPEGGDGGEPAPRSRKRSSEPDKPKSGSGGEPNAPTAPKSSPPQQSSTASGGEPEPLQRPSVPKKGEIAPQMEDGGGRREGGKDSPTSESLPPAREFVARFLEIRAEHWPGTPNFPAPTLTLEAQARDWIGQGATIAMVDETLRRAMARKVANHEGPPTDFGCVNRSLKDAIARAKVANGNTKPTGGAYDGEYGYDPDREQPKRTRTDDEWRAIMRRFENTGDWPPYAGVRPFRAGNETPPHILAEFAHLGDCA